MSRRALVLRAVFALAFVVTSIGVPILPNTQAQTASGQPDCLDTDTNGNRDNDGDGLCDNWEDTGVDVNKDGTVDLQLYDVNKNGTIDPDERADKNHKDLYVEVDAMHPVNAEAINDVVLAFANAPVDNPDGTKGIRLRFQVDEQVTHQDQIVFVGPSVPVPDACPTTTTYPANHYCSIRLANFGTANERTAGALKLDSKRFVARYALFAHALTTPPSGVAVLGGDDEVISLASLGSEANGDHGSRNQVAGTLMHEFGHNLNLLHGGADDVNCKPNYLSVLNYSYEVENVPATKRPLDFSRIALPDLDENALNEALGVQGPPGREAPFGPAPIMNGPANGPIDFNRNGVVPDTSPVTANVNENSEVGCAGTETLLKGGEDWSRLRYGTSFAQEAAQPPALVAHATEIPFATHEEVTAQGLESMAPDSDGDGTSNLFDDCVFTSDPDQLDADVDGIGNACEANLPPLVDAGPDELIKAGRPLVLSVDPGTDDPADVIVLSWDYTVISASRGASCAIPDPSLFETTITCTKAGTYSVRMTVTDGVTPAVSDSFTLTVKGKQRTRGGRGR